MSRIQSFNMHAYTHTHLATTNNRKSFYSHLYYAKLSSLILSNPNPSMMAPPSNAARPPPFYAYFVIIICSTLYMLASQHELFSSCCSAAYAPHHHTSPQNHLPNIQTRYTYIHTYRTHTIRLQKTMFTFFIYDGDAICSVVDDCVVWI